MKKLTSDGVRKAERDYLAARELNQNLHPFPDQIAFHSQQAAEKYFQAILQEQGLAIPRTHDLKTLLGLLLPLQPSLRSVSRGADFLTRFAVETRYPGDGASKRQALSALRWAERVRHTVRSLLGLP